MKKLINGILETYEYEIMFKRGDTLYLKDLQVADSEVEETTYEELRERFIEEFKSKLHHEPLGNKTLEDIISKLEDRGDKKMEGSIIIGKYVGETTLNGVEYLLNSRSEEYMVFESKEQAQNYISKHCDDKSMVENFLYFKIEEDNSLIQI